MKRLQNGITQLKRFKTCEQNMHESKKRTLNLTPSSNIQAGGKKRMLDGSPHKLKGPFGANDTEDWQKQFLVQSRELRRLEKLNEFLELERECNA
ncbi:(Zrou_YGOB_18260) [Zygosaccharomyces parabailii]|nr:(Zrou_YGOB_18260) [Zygosaccharomyces parabailii]